MTTPRVLGWVPPAPHHRRSTLKLARTASAIVLPDASTLSDNTTLCVPSDQQYLACCQTSAAAQTIAMESVRGGLELRPSVLAGYYWNRERWGDQLHNVGATIGESYRAYSEMGIPAEDDWPFVPGRFAVRPPPKVDRAAFDRRGTLDLHYVSMDESGARLCALGERVLASGRGFAFGVQVSQKFCLKPPTDVVGPPGPADVIAGGHALTAVGHDRAGGYFFVKGSWGDDWREPGLPPGCIRLSYEYVALGQDCWYCALAPGGVK